MSINRLNTTLGGGASLVWYNDTWGNARIQALGLMPFGVETHTILGRCYRMVAEMILLEMLEDLFLWEASCLGLVVAPKLSHWSWSPWSVTLSLEYGCLVESWLAPESTGMKDRVLPDVSPLITKSVSILGANYVFWILDYLWMVGIEVMFVEKV